MRTRGSILLSALIFISCQSTEKSTIEASDSDSEIINIPNLITPQIPDETDILNQTVYVDHVEIIMIKQIPNILIQGHLPNPCCNLDTIEEIIQNGNIHLNLNAWQPLDAICTQALQPFSLLHPLPEILDPGSLGYVFVNNTPYEL